MTETWSFHGKFKNEVKPFFNEYEKEGFIYTIQVHCNKAVYKNEKHNVMVIFTKTSNNS